MVEKNRRADLFESGFVVEISAPQKRAVISIHLK